MKKKALSILLTAAMAVTLLAGCGSSSDNAGSTAASGDTTAESAAGSEAAAGSDKTVVNFYYSTDLEKKSKHLTLPTATSKWWDTASQKAIMTIRLR